MDINVARDFVLGVAGKQIRGEAISPRERDFVKILASLPGYKNPVKVACPKCAYNVVLLFDENDEIPANTFERDTAGQWHCLWCRTSDATAQVMHVH